MDKIKVANGQNIYDIAMANSGSIEGVFDLMISNPELSMAEVLEFGQELSCHKSFVLNKSVKEYLDSNQIVMANDGKSLVLKDLSETPKMLLSPENNVVRISFLISGNGQMTIDWDDNTPLQSVILSNNPVRISHSMNTKEPSRTICFYGDFTIREWDMTGVDGELRPIESIVVDEFTWHANSHSLEGLFLFKNTYKLDLTRSVVPDLSFVNGWELQELNLKGVTFASPMVFSDYLSDIIERHQNRRACKVYADVELTSEMEDKILTIISEPDWNSPEPWEFYIQDQIFKFNG